MNFVLLLGAGFSRNWGGWLANEAFEYLLGCPQIRSSGLLRETLWRHRTTGGFEQALAQIQTEHAQAPSAGTRQALVAFQGAVSQMFGDMNRAFARLDRFEFQDFVDRMLRTFLVRFDAIFTLNQDLLLEYHYLNGNVALAQGRRWNGAQMPGMLPIANGGLQGAPNWGDISWRPREEAAFVVERQLQPYFKLHGSSNWVDREGGELIVMGGNKTYAIRSHAVLTWYYDQFRDYLSRPETRLMVIGYGFRDGHVDQVIRDIAPRGQLQMFIVDPLGADVVNQTRDAAIRARDPLEDILIGASRRSLRELFGSDAVEHGKVVRFFDP